MEVIARITAVTSSIKKLLSKIQSYTNRVRDVPSQVSSLSRELQDIVQVLKLQKTVQEEVLDHKPNGAAQYDNSTNLLLHTLSQIQTSLQRLDAEASKVPKVLLYLSGTSGPRRMKYLQNELSQLGRCNQFLLRLLTIQTLRLDLLSLKELPLNIRTVISETQLSIATSSDNFWSREARSPNNSCSSFCQCSCHELHTISSPRRLTPVIGCFHVRYSYRPICNVADCGRPSVGSKANILYMFPWWLLRKSVHISTRYGMVGSGVIKGGILDIIKLGHNSPLSHCIATGDIQGMYELFFNNKVSPMSIDERGDTLFHIAIRDGQFEVCKSLLHFGVDPYRVNTYNSAADLACDRVLSGVADSSVLDFMDPDGLALRARQFSRVHLIVLGLGLPCSLKDELYWNPNIATDIDSTDVDGRTPLYWAIRRKDVDSATILLDGGASANAGISAIAWTCKDPHECLETLKLLLKADADLDGTDTDGHTALQACGIYGRDIAFTSELISHGASLEVAYNGPYSQYRGITPFGFAALYAHLHVLQHLSSCGANTDHQDYQGRSPVHLAVQSHHRNPAAGACLDWLIQSGADFEIRDYKDYTPANLAMRLQDVECLCRLMDAGADISPPYSDPYQARNAYVILEWPLRKGWTEVVKFLLPRINLDDRDPKTGNSILQAMARWGNSGMLVALDDAIFALPSLSGFSVLLTDYEVNSELLEKSRFEGLLHRMKQKLQEESLSLPTSLERSHEDDEDLSSVEHQTTSTEGGLQAFRADLHAAKEVSLSGGNDAKWDPEYDEEYECNDEGIHILRDPDSELSLQGWHSDATFMEEGNQANYDSGYATDSSEYGREPSHVLSRRIDIQKMEMLLRKGQPTNTDTGEGAGHPGMEKANLDTLSGPSRVIQDAPYEIFQGEILLVAVMLCVPVLLFGILFVAVISSVGILLVAVISCVFLVEGYRKMASMHRHMRRILSVRLRPRIVHVYIRVTWSCWCGTQLYADLPNSDQEKVREFSDALNNTLSSQDTNSSTVNAGSNSGLQPPPPVYIRSQSVSSSPNSTSRPQMVPGAINDSAGSSVSNAMNNQSTIPKYLELCINTGKSCQTLGEINLTRVSSDDTLFAWIRKRYHEVRGSRHHWTLYLLKPVAMRFVSFGLEHKTKVHINQRDVYPTEQDVRDNKWHSNPCSPDLPFPMSSDAFIHYLCYCDEKAVPTKRSRHWLDRLPKKMNESILRTSESLVHGYGMHIVEGINITAVLWTLFVVLLVCLGPLIAYVVLNGDVQGAMSVGGLSVAVLTLLLTAALFSGNIER